MTKIEATNVLKEFIETYIKSHGEEDIITVQLDNVDIEAFSTIVKELEKETVSRETYEHEYFLRNKFEVKAWKLERLIEDWKQNTLDDAREDFMFDIYNILDFLPTNNEANQIIDVFDRVTSGLKQEPCKDTKYEKDLNELKEQILKDGNTLVSKRDLLERFCDMDEEYNGEPWNLLQILSNINILIGQEPCEDAISRADAIRVASGYCHPSNIAKELTRLQSVQSKLTECEDAISRQAVLSIAKEDCETAIIPYRRFVKDITTLPSVKSPRKKGKWINKSRISGCGVRFVASECTCCGKKTFFDCDQLVYNYCPNCGAEMGK